jgi:hypothetical protein
LNLPQKPLDFLKFFLKFPLKPPSNGGITKSLNQRVRRATKRISGARRKQPAKRTICVERPTHDQRSVPDDRIRYILFSEVAGIDRLRGCTKVWSQKDQEEKESKKIMPAEKEHGIEFAI